MSYSAKISRKGGSLKGLFVTKPDAYEVNDAYCCVEDHAYDHEADIREAIAELSSEEDILSAWLDGLKEEHEE